VEYPGVEGYPGPGRNPAVGYLGVVEYLGVEGTSGAVPCVFPLRAIAADSLKEKDLERG